MRVDKDAEVTVVVLIYKSLAWLDFVMQGLDTTRQNTRYRWCVVSVDGTDEVRADPRITVDYSSDDPSEYYLNRVYRAWNEGVLNAPTNLVVLANSDMRFTDHAIDELVAVKDFVPKSLPCSLLVENGRIPSGMPEYVRNFGYTPLAFKEKAFHTYANSIRQRGKSEPGRLYQPVLFDRQEFMDMGGYPEGNVGSVSGDRFLFDRYTAAGYQWLTCLGSVVAHVQEGEMRDS